jgi:hypothetical protein
MTFTVYVADLSAVFISGSGNVVTKTKFAVDNLELNISGSGNIDFDADATDISGSGNITLTELQQFLTPTSIAAAM